MKQRKFIAQLNMDRLRTIHSLIDRLAPVAPLSPERVAALKRAATACGAEIAGEHVAKMVGWHDPDFFDVPAGETEAGRRKVKRLLRAKPRRGFVKKT